MKPAICLIVLFFAANCLSMKVSSSSFLKGTINYPPENAIDGNVRTAWVEGDSGDGTGEWIALDFGKNRTVRYLGVIPGYAKNTELWEQNNRILTADLIFSDSSVKKLSFPNDTAMKYFGIDKLTSGIKVKITSVKRGSKYNDACISEIKPIIDKSFKFADSTATHENPDFKYNYIKEYIYNIRPFTIVFTAGIEAGIMMGYPGLTLFTYQFSKVSDSLFISSEEIMDFNQTLEFSLSSKEVELIGVEKRTDYRYILGHGDAGYSDWIDENTTITPKHDNLTDELSYYSPWETITPRQKSYSVFKFTGKWLQWWGNIDSLNIEIPADQKAESYAGTLMHKKYFSDYHLPVVAWKKRDHRCYSIHSIQFKITYSKDSTVKRLYLVLYKPYGQ